MKAKFTKALPKYVHYHNYKNVNKQDFKLELRGNLEVDAVDANYETFHNVYLNVLNKHAPIKTKVIRGNQAPYITKAYRKAVMKRSELKTKYLLYLLITICKTCCHFKNRTEEHIKKDNKSHIFKHLHSIATSFDSYNFLCLIRLTLNST